MLLFVLQVRINVPSFCDRVLLSSFPGTQVNNMAYGIDTFWL